LKATQKTVIYFILILYALVNLYPMIWMVMNSLKTDQQISLHPFGPPTGFFMDNYANAWNQVALGTGFLNSAWIGIIATIAAVFLGAVSAYFISRFEFKGRSFVYTYLIFGMLIPVHATLVPLFILESKLGIMNTPVSLLFPYVSFNLPITIFILVSFMKGFHRDIEESAIIDGCGIIQLFWSVILPMTRPALATVVILNFIHNWNEFAFALVLVNDSALKTLPLAIASLAGQFTTSVSTQMAGLTIAMIPTLIIYFFLQNQLVKGMTAGAVKG
jgi:raffinose/stachyose/melibiose transport system permease protein